MDNKIFAYVRVSSADQNLDRQIDSMLKYVRDRRDIYFDKQSGKDFNRPGYEALKYNLRAGDELYIHALTRFGRNKIEIKEQLEELRQKGVLVRVLDVPTTLMDFKSFGSLQKSIMDMVNNILIEVLATMAEAERHNIRVNQLEGIAAAKRRGRKFGRPKIDFPAGWDEAYKNWKSSNTTAVAVMRKFGLTSSTFYRLVKRYNAKCSYINAK